MDTEQMKSPPQPYEFRAKPAWQRLLIMVGGVVMNVVFALIIYIGMSYKWGETVLENKDIVYGYTFNSLGQEMGFRNGDRIVDIDGKPATEYLDVLKSILISQPEYVTVDRNGQKIRIDITDESINRLLQSADSTSLLMPRIPFVVGSVVSGSGAAQAGLHPGDSLISYNGTPMTFFDQYSSAFHAAPGDTVTLGLVRKTDGMTKITTLPVKVSAEGTIGVYPRTIDSMLTFSTHNYRSRDQQLHRSDQTAVQPQNRSLQIAGRSNHHGKYLPHGVGLATFLEHHGLPVDHPRRDEHPSDPRIGRRTRAVPTRRGHHPPETE